MFDISLLADRVSRIIKWGGQQPEIARLPVGLFGASTGAAAAMLAASRSKEVAAIACRGGRIDLASEIHSRIAVPTLLIVGEDDHMIVEINAAAAGKMRSAHVLVRVIPGASHLFSEEGAMEEVSMLSSHWFALYLNGSSTSRR